MGGKRGGRLNRWQERRLEGFLLRWKGVNLIYVPTVLHRCLVRWEMCLGDHRVGKEIACPIQIRMER